MGLFRGSAHVLLIVEFFSEILEIFKFKICFHKLEYCNAKMQFYNLEKNFKIFRNLGFSKIYHGIAPPYPT